MVKITHEKLIQLVRQKGRDFDPRKFRDEVQALMEKADPFIEANRDNVPAYITARTEINKALPKLESLDAYELGSLAGHISGIEHQVKGINLEESLCFEVLGKSFLVDQNAATLYAHLAEIASLQEGLLSREESLGLYRKAYDLFEGLHFSKDHEIGSRLISSWPNNGEVKTNPLELIEKLKQKGRKFTPEQFRRETKELLAKAEPYLQEDKRNVVPSGYYSRRDEVLEYLLKLEHLDSHQLCDVGAKVSTFEQPLTGVRDLTDSIGAIAIGRSLILDPESYHPYFMMGMMINVSIKKVLDKKGVSVLYEKALSCPDVDAETRGAIEGNLRNL